MARLVSDLRIGGEEKGPEFHFSVISAILPHDSLVFVTQYGDATIRVYDLTGRFVRRIGRSGAGPGEFQGGVWKMGFVGDTLWAIDDSHRVSYFSTHGELLQTTTYGGYEPPTLGARFHFFEQPQALTENGGALGFGSYGEAQRAAGLVPFKPILSFTRDMHTIDTLAWVSTANGTIDVRAGPYRKQPFSDEPLIAYSPSGDRVIIVNRTAATEVDGAAYTITAIAAKGDSLWSHKYTYPPIPVNDQVVDSVRSWVRSKYASWGISASVVDRALFVPKFQNTVTAVVIGTDSRLWLRREDGDSLVRYTILDESGKESATINVPRQLSIHWASRTHVWGQELDETDVPTIVRFRLTPESRN